MVPMTKAEKAKLNRVVKAMHVIEDYCEEVHSVVNECTGCLLREYFSDMYPGNDYSDGQCPLMLSPHNWEIETPYMYDEVGS